MNQLTLARAARRCTGAAAAVAMFATVISLTVQAQAFPSKPVRVVVPFPAGGSFDVTARILAQRMQAGLGQNVVVENRPGGGTVIGTEYVVRQPPDGHTVLMIGTSHHLLIEALKLSAKIDIVHTPFQGAAHAVPAMVGGHVTASLLNLSDMIVFIKAGKLRALVVLSPTRDEGVPEVPTVRESGFPELEAINWSGFVVHSATPAGAIARLNAETVKALNMPEVRDNLRALSVIATPGTPDEFAALIKSDGERYRRIIREANVRLE